MESAIDLREYKQRLTRAASELGASGNDALLVTPGTDLSYLCGYDAVALERLTCLIVSAEADPVMVVPELEVLAAKASPAGELGIKIASWQETESPHKLVSKYVRQAHRIAVDPHMWAAHVFALTEALPLVRFSADTLVSRLRAVKSQAEIDALIEAGAAIDRVHAAVPDLIKVGMTEREVGSKIADRILAEGHSTVDFVIVASGPNGASPHHEVSDRVIEQGDPIVVDIGGTMPSGYCSDSTRNYIVGQPDPEYVKAFEVLMAAQQASVDHATVGVTAASVDAAGRDLMAEAGLGEAFVHRTGHGIGLDTHEEPYIVSSNTDPLVAGNAFSVEPGFYFPGTFGARIEDILVVTDDKTICCNNQPHDLVIIDA